MREFNLSTARGRRIYDMGNRCYAPSLSYLYDKWSEAKENVFNECFEEYLNTENGSAFGVGNANTFGFTASWIGGKQGDEFMIVETKDNSYLVWLNR